MPAGAPGTQSPVLRQLPAAGAHGNRRMTLTEHSKGGSGLPFMIVVDSPRY